MLTRLVFTIKKTPTSRPENCREKARQHAFIHHCLRQGDNSAGSKKIEKYRNWGIKKERRFLSLPTHHFAFPKLYLFFISALIESDREYQSFSIP